MVWFFLVGALLLVVPLVLVVVWDSPLCSLAQTPTPSTAGYCPSPSLFKNFISFFPFLMIIGAVLIGYNLKRISDSLLPPKGESGEDDTIVSDR
jgi:hypothetical protein